MSSIPLPALSIKPPQIESPMDQYSKMIQMKSLLNAQQLQQGEIQQQQYGLAQTDSLQKELATAGHGAAIPGIMKGVTDWKKSQADLEQVHSKLQSDARDSLGSLGYAIQQSKYDPRLAATLLQDRLSTVNLPANEAQQLSSAFKMIQANPATLKQFADNAVLQSPKQQELLNAQKVAGIRAGNTPVDTDRIEQLNQGLAARYQVLNPGKPLPPYLNLPPDATAKDFDRVDKLLESQERATGTKAQQDTTNQMRQSQNQIANEMRQQTQAIAQQGLDLRTQAQKDTAEKQGLAWVSWQDKDGRTIAGPLSEARKAGAENPAAVPTEEVRNITDARQAVNLINKQGDATAPETMGVLQLAQSLDKEGKMGVFSSRMNNLLTKGVGAMPNDDPRVVTLLDKSQLLMTLAMKAHFGASGGRSPQMLEHFISMANAGKMDGPTFIGGAKAVGNYMEDRAMMPASMRAGGGTNQPAKTAGPPPGATHTAPGSDGKMHYTNAQGQDLGVAQ